MKMILFALKIYMEEYNFTAKRGMKIPLNLNQKGNKNETKF